MAVESVDSIYLQPNMKSNQSSDSAGHGEHGRAHPSPVVRLWELIVADRSDLIVLLVYTCITGLLSLAVPLAAQALVNTIAAGIFLQPLIVLSLLVLAGLLLGSILRMLKFCIVENLSSYTNQTRYEWSILHDHFSTRRNHRVNCFGSQPTSFRSNFTPSHFIQIVFCVYILDF